MKLFLELEVTVITKHDLFVHSHFSQKHVCGTIHAVSQKQYLNQRRKKENCKEL